MEPADQTVTSQSIVVVRGLAAPGSIVTRDIPLWFDEHTTTDAVGRWSMAVTLNPGENVFTFRVGDDVTTVRTLTLHYVP